MLRRLRPNDQVNMIAGNRVVQEGYILLTGCLEQPLAIPTAVLGKLQEKLAVMAAMGNVINVSRKDVAIGTS